MAAPSGRRNRREWNTLVTMVDMYCQHHHGHGSCCNDCNDLIDYARRKLARCPYGDAKPTCANCPIHCYQAKEREQVRRVMRWSGPRMLRRHPVLAVLHLLDGRRQPPPRPRRKARPSQT